MKRLKILVSCYACSPYQGSEPGMGWNFVLAISRHHELHVIVECQFAKPLDKKKEEAPELFQNLHFHFIERERHNVLRKIWPPSYYWYYKKWQKAAYRLGLKLEEKENFDLVHQLNMVGFREPGYLWKMNKPFVWGPIGGMEITPWRFLPSLGLYGFLFFLGRNLINSFERKYSIRPKCVAQRDNKILIAATPETQLQILKQWGQKSVVIPEVGSLSNTQINLAKRDTNQPLRIIWSGLHIPRKGLNFLLDAFGALKAENLSIELHILGDGLYNKKWKSKAAKLGIRDQTFWYGWQKQAESYKIMATGHVFCITSLHDLTSTVTLEAISLGLPVVCFDHCGFAEVINETCGIKIPVISPKSAMTGFANAIKELYLHEDKRFALAKGALERAKNYEWPQKADHLNSLYSKLTDHDQED